MNRDTSSRAQQAYFRRLAAMTPQERIDVGVALWNAGDSLQRAAIRHGHPDATERDIEFRLVSLRFGPELARRAYRIP